MARFEQLRRRIPAQRLPELEALPEPLDETELIALALLAIEHIDEELEGGES